MQKLRKKPANKSKKVLPVPTGFRSTGERVNKKIIPTKAVSYDR